MIFILQQIKPWVGPDHWKNVAAYADVNEASADLSFYPPSEARVIKLETRGGLAKLLLEQG